MSQRATRGLMVLFAAVGIVVVVMAAIGFVQTPNSDPAAPRPTSGQVSAGATSAVSGDAQAAISENGSPKVTSSADGRSPDDDGALTEWIFGGMAILLGMSMSSIELSRWKRRREGAAASSTISFIDFRGKNNHS